MMLDIHKQTSIKLHWMRHDLRVKDNQALANLCLDEKAFIVVVYVFQPQYLKENEFMCKPLGKYRKAFIDQSLDAVKEQLDELNIPFLCLEGDAVAVINQLIADLKVETLSGEFHAGYYEQAQLTRIRKQQPMLKMLIKYSNMLFDPQQLPFSINEMPDVFSPFRKKIEKGYTVNEECNALKPRKLVDCKNLFAKYKEYHPSNISYKNGFVGGPRAALQRIDSYFFKEHRIASYKETRNQLDGMNFSSRLSAYLSCGCISPRSVYSYIKQYEKEYAANDSTYWLFFELLWREFFQWQHVKHGVKNFDFSGINNNTEVLNRHDPILFEQWKKGSTGYPIVDACMQQLAQTGWMSNRGRQLVASCFVNELNLDWRYGAAYFEEMLVDYDVASNYGNWQYLAGVGSDPRGRRHFNLEKQTQLYDPQNTFVQKWIK